MTVTARSWTAGRCTSCDGAGTRPVLARFAMPTRCEWINTPCYDCESTGELTAARAEALNAGEAMRVDRVNRGLTLREEARRLGIDRVELSHREQGR